MIILETNQLSTFDWGTFLGALGSIAAVFVALFTAYFQVYQFKKNREPLISPTIKKLDFLIPDILSDWEEDEELKKKFSNTFLSLGNFGYTTVFDVSYSFKAKNIIEIQKYLQEGQTGEELVIKNLEIDEKKQIFNIEIITENGKKIYHKNRRYTHRLDPIGEGRSIKVPLPSYFILLSNFILANMSPFDEDEILPELELFIYYTDVDMKKWKIVYDIKWDIVRETKHSDEGMTIKGTLISKLEFKSKLKNKVK